MKHRQTPAYFQIATAAKLSILGAALVCAGRHGSTTRQTPPKSSDASELRLAPAPPDLPRAETETGAPLRCPHTVVKTRVSSVRTKRGVAVVFATVALAKRDEARARARELAPMYNSVYGADTERTSWAKAQRSPDGSRVQWATFTEPDIDARVEPVPEASEDELEALRERIQDYVTRMQAGEAGPVMRELVTQGAKQGSGLDRES